MASLLAYIRGLIGRWFRGSSPVPVLFGVQSTRYSLPSLSVFKMMSPQRSSFCSLHPRRPKWIMLFSHTVFNRACGELNPSSFLSKSRCDFWSVSESMSLELLLFRFRRVFSFFEITVFEDSFAVTGATQKAFNTSQKSAERDGS